MTQSQSWAERLPEGMRLIPMNTTGTEMLLCLVEMTLTVTPQYLKSKGEGSELSNGYKG